MCGVAVLVSRCAGPAVFGVRRPAIVLPAWVLSMRPRARRLIFLHESEHRRVGDSRVLFAAAVLVAVVPWNPFAWIQAARLRRSVELDCDARVLERTGDAHAYGRLLLEVGARAAGISPALATGMSVSRPFLERRIATLLNPPRWRPVRALVVVSLGILLLAWIPAPMRTVVVRGVAAPAGVLMLREQPAAGGAPAGDPSVGEAEPAGTVRAAGRGVARIVPANDTPGREQDDARGGGLYRYDPADGR
jgi:hypothetical protein